MTNAVPLDSETRQKFAVQTPPRSDKASPDVTPAAPKRTTVRKLGGTSAPAPTSPRQSQTQPDAGFDRVTLRQVKQGKMAIEGRLDLHGMTQAQAHTRLRGFVEQSALAGKRCVLVITGKGAPVGERETLRGAAVGRGVLREMTPNWLSGGDISRYIVGYQPALPRDGGNGALYVRLRRPK